MTLKLSIFLLYLSSIYLLGCSTTHWIKDPTTGCEVLYPNPKPNIYIEYNGDCLEGKANGYGELTWFLDSIPSSTFKGNFVSGKLEGLVSAETYESTIHRFEGMYKSGIREGFGTYYFHFGKTISGVFHQGMLSDSVSIVWKNGKHYLGHIEKFDEMSGQGSLTFPNGDKYTGEFLNNKRHGKGVYKWSNGDTYEGVYKDDRRTRKGFYTFTDSSKYTINEIPDTSIIQQEQPTLLRSGLIEEKTRKDFCSALTKRIPYPQSLLRAAVELDANLKLQIGGDGELKQYRFSVVKITPMMKSKSSVSGYEPDPSEYISRIPEEEAMQIIKVVQESGYPLSSEEGETIDLWITIPLRFRLRNSRM